MALVATSASGDGLGWLGLGVARAHLVQAAAGWLFGRLAERQSSWRVLRAMGPALDAALWASCCGWRTSLADVRLTGEMAADAGFATMLGFLPTLQQHQRLPSLAAFRGLPTLVVNGTADLVVPPADSRAIVEELPGATALVVPRAGHNIMLAAPWQVTDALLALVAAGSAEPAA